MPFLNQGKGENDRRKHFMINLHERMLRPRRGLNPRPPGLQSDGASNSASSYQYFVQILLPVAETALLETWEGGGGGGVGEGEGGGRAWMITEIRKFNVFL